MNVMRAAPHTCKNAATFSFVIRTLYRFNDCAFPICFLPNLGQFFLIFIVKQVKMPLLLFHVN